MLFESIPLQIAVFFGASILCAAFAGVGLAAFQAFKIVDLELPMTTKSMLFKCLITWILTTVVFSVCNTLVVVGIIALIRLMHIRNSNIAAALLLITPVFIAGMFGAAMLRLFQPINFLILWFCNSATVVFAIGIFAFVLVMYVILHMRPML